MTRQISSLVAFASVVAICSLAAAQGLLIDVRANHVIPLPRPIPMPTPPPSSYKIEALKVHAKFVDQIAQVQVEQTFVNTGSQQMEVAFVFPLPYDGAIDQLTLLVDGKEYAAKLLPADEARKAYEEIVRKNRDPALLEWVGTGMFQTSVFPIPPGAKRTVTLRYSQLCRMSHGLTDFVFPLSTAKYTAGPLDKLEFHATVESQSDLKNVYSPTHAVNIERPDKQHAIISYEAKDTLPSEDFRLMFDTGKQGVGASVVSYRPDKDKDGYFLLLTTPEIKAADDKPLAKTVVFVVDRSGSMTGEKIEQAKNALTFVLKNLREGDLFNIVAYDTAIESFRPELQRYDEETRKAAEGFVAGLYAGGSTDINGALQRALGMLEDSSRPTYVIFLTDGLPTAGEVNESKIVENAEQANHVRARVFPFGVGYDVNSRLLDRLARANFGQSEYVRPDEDIEAAVSKLYRRIGTPVMTDVEVAFDVEGVVTADGTVVNRVYPKGKFDLFAGDQMVLVGRYRKSGAAKVTIRGAVGSDSQAFDFPADLVEKSDDDTNSFVAKLWATRRVGEIIDELDLKGRNEELIKELVALATEHGILTPYTSFMADETTNIRDLSQNRSRASREAEEGLQEFSGGYAFNQRSEKAGLQTAARPSSASGGLGGAALSADVSDKLARNRGRGTIYYDAVVGRQVATTNVYSLGRKTFFQRDGVWVDSSVSEEEQNSARQVERFSRDYFDLVERYGKHVSQYLAVDEPIVVKLEGETYQW